jgi:hypothetical protein
LATSRLKTGSFVFLYVNYKGKGKGKELDSSLFLERVKSPWKVSAHVSAAGGVENAVTNAITIGFVKSWIPFKPFA